MPAMAPCRVLCYGMMTRLPFNYSVRERVSRYTHVYRIVPADTCVWNSDTEN